MRSQDMQCNLTQRIAATTLNINDVQFKLFIDFSN